MELPPSTACFRADPDEMHPEEMLSQLRRRGWLILSATVFCAIAAFIITSLLPRTYKVAVVLSPVTVTPGDERGGLLSSTLGGLAGLAGLSAGGENKKYESLAVLQSQALLDKYLREQHLLPVLYPKQDQRRPPTYWQATQYFSKRILSVALDTKTGLVTLSIAWRDPVQAARWANDLVHLSNDYLRGRAIEQSDRNIAYLKREAENAVAVQVRTSIYEMMGTEIRRGMMARGDEEYAFKILDPALVPESPSSLPPWVWVLIATVCGFTLSIAATLARVDRDSGASGVAGRG